MSFINFLKNCHDKNTLEQYKRGSVLEFSDQRAKEIVGAGVAKEVGGGEQKREEVLIQGWASITTNTYSEIGLDQYDYDIFTILVYMRKGQNRQGVKFELTKSELQKLLSKATTNELVITRTIAGINNANDIALLKQTVQRPTQESTGVGTLKIKYQLFEGGNAVTGLDNLEWCMYAHNF